MVVVAVLLAVNIAVVSWQDKRTAGISVMRPDVEAKDVDTKDDDSKEVELHNVEVDSKTRRDEI